MTRTWQVCSIICGALALVSAASRTREETGFMLVMALLFGLKADIAEVRKRQDGRESHETLQL